MIELQPLPMHDLQAMCSRALAHVKEQLAKQRIALRVEDDVAAWLAGRAGAATSAASVARLVRQHLQVPLVGMLGQGGQSRSVAVRVEQDSLRVEWVQECRPL